MGKKKKELLLVAKLLGRGELEDEFARLTVENRQLNAEIRALMDERDSIVGLKEEVAEYEEIVRKLKGEAASLKENEPAWHQLRRDGLLEWAQDEIEGLEEEVEEYEGIVSRLKAENARLQALMTERLSTQAAESSRD